MKRGTNRGEYKRNSYEKKLIVDAAENVYGDWRAVAKFQDIPIGTAENKPKKRGGARNQNHLLLAVVY